MKVCSKCKIEKFISEFYRASHCDKGVRPECKNCNGKMHKDRIKRKGKVHFSERRRVLLKYKYKISIEEYEERLKTQNGTCKICHKIELIKNGHLSVDHCHKTKRIRGLLCHQCNAGLGFFRDNIDFLNDAVKYLEENCQNLRL